MVDKAKTAGSASGAEIEAGEFGTQWVQGGERCYLRRRDKSGAWKQSDFLPVLPGVTCEAIDMKISPAGAIFVLARRASNNSMRWWLGEFATWGASPANRGLGEKDHVAAAVGLHASGMVAVCMRRASAYVLR
jgi:hypothetical protein